jgi:polysaccharide biosynthesis protein PslG
MLVLLVLAGAWPISFSHAAAPASAFGLNTHIATRYGNYSAMAWPADVIASSGAGWAREDFQWFSIEPTRGHFQWYYSDRMVDLLTARGVNIIGVLGHPPGWATPEPGDDSSGVSFFAPDPQEFAAFAGAVVQRYRYRIVHWELWNEPDNPQFWRPQPDPLAYARLLSATYPVIHQLAPEDNVLLGGINPFDSSYLQTIADVGAWWAFDILNIHPYVDPATPEANGEIGQAAMANVQRVADKAGAKPIWVTEYGWSAGPSERDPASHTSEADQADYLVRGAVLLRAAGAQRVLWYSLKDEAHNGYGLLRFARSYDDLSQPRPAFSAFMALNQELRGASFERRLDTFDVVQGGDVYALRFVRDGETIDVIWALTPSTILLPSTQARADVVNRAGDSWSVAAEAGRVQLFPDGSPIYVHQHV